MDDDSIKRAAGKESQAIHGNVPDAPAKGPFDKKDKKDQDDPSEDPRGNAFKKVNEAREEYIKNKTEAGRVDVDENREKRTVSYQRFVSHTQNLIRLLEQDLRS